MGFSQADVDDLLARAGRMCAICKRRHRVQIHHIVPVGEGGTDEISNGIPLCPNCHDEVHTPYYSGRTTRIYKSEELRRHLQETIELASRQTALTQGDEDWERDVELVRFYAECLDRPAFRTHFHEELSYSDFDQALEDSLLAINTGLWRTRDGILIERSLGKARVVNPRWRDFLEVVVGSIERSRFELRSALGLNQMLMERRRGRMDWLDDFDVDLRTNRSLGSQLDTYRQEAIDAINRILRELGDPLLRGIGEW